MDIVKALPDGAGVTLRSRATKRYCGQEEGGTHRDAAGTGLPSIEPATASDRFSLPVPVAKRLIEKTQFAMAHQDVRYYLNGLLLEIRPGRVRTVTTDGHRLALCDATFEGDTGMDIQVILPRKAVIELVDCWMIPKRRSLRSATVTCG